MKLVKVIRLLAVALTCAAGLGGVGCATQQKEVRTAHFVLSHPDYWNVKSVGQNDGEPTTIVIGQYGSAIIDDGSGALASKGANYETVQADVETKIYAWAEPPGVTNPSQAVASLLVKDTTLQLNRHVLVPDQPQECGLLKRKYDLLKTPQEPIDLLSRPGWRTIVVGARSSGVLLGVVARVEFEDNPGRYCHNLNNLRVQLQNLLDGLSVVPATAAAPPPPTPGVALPDNGGGQPSSPPIPPSPPIPIPGSASSPPTPARP